MLKVLAVLLAVILIVCLLVAMVMAQARLLNQCLNISIALGVVLVLIPGVNLIGLILLAIAGALVLLGQCKTCEEKNKT